MIGIIAILASLLLSSLAGAKKRARIAKCTSNLRQISIALNLYLDDHGNQRPDGFQNLVDGGYLLNDAILRCPEDRTTEGWGRLVAHQLGDAPFLTGGDSAMAGDSMDDTVSFSYLHPFSGPDSLWRSVLNQQSRTGFATCQLHGIGEAREEAPSIFAFEGTVLRGQLDGSVVNRKFYWDRGPIETPPDFAAPANPSPDAGAGDFPVGLFVDPGTVLGGE